MFKKPDTGIYVQLPSFLDKSEYVIEYTTKRKLSNFRVRNPKLIGQRCKEKYYLVEETDSAGVFVWQNERREDDW